MRLLLITLFTLLCYFTLTDAVVGPCVGKNIREACTKDDDCGPLNTRCRNGLCACGDNFQEATLQDELRICQPAPDEVDAVCTTNCVPPLICDAESKKCICTGDKVVNGKCLYNCPAGTEQRGIQCKKVSHFGQQCDNDEECEDPFTKCIKIGGVGKGKCECGPQSRKVGQTCQPLCPNGFPSKRTCKKNFRGNAQLLERLPKTDTCNSGHYCVTSGGVTGMCCPLTCPYGSPISNKECRDDAYPSNKCESGNGAYFCYRMQSDQLSNSICCPNPCREPTPVYLNGECQQRAFLGDSCIYNEQCDGGSSLVCTNGLCTCKGGYVEDTKAKFPICKLACEVSNAQVSVDGKTCVPPKPRGSVCQSNRQCVSGLICKQSICRCPCGMGWNGRICVTLKVLENSPNDILGWLRKFVGGDQPATT